MLYEHKNTKKLRTPPPPYPQGVSLPFSNHLMAIYFSPQITRIKGKDRVPKMP
jgi:hypothetical protein